MVVKTSDKPNLPHDFDDDGPVIYKRYSSSKKNQLHSEVRKSSSHSHDGQSYRQISNAPSSNGQTSSMQKGSTAPSAKPLPVNPSAGISKASNSLVNSSSVKSPLANSKSPSLGDKRKISIDVMEEPSKLSAKSLCEDSEDDEDIKLLSFRLKNSNHDNKASHVVVKKYSEDSNDDDVVPLLKKLFRNSNLGRTSSNHDDSDQKKPIPKIQKEQQNGSGTSNNQDRPSPLPVKRPLDISNSLHPSVKKSKVSDSAPSIKTKPVSVKHELVEDDDDDNDDVPITLRIKKSATSGDKSSSNKVLTKVNLVNKSGSKPFKKQAKQTFKKWTTLVDNGVIFSPPYKPHGVKILYKGQPVYLTPGQEELATMYAVMGDTVYILEDRFKENLWSDWQMLLGTNHVIQNLKDCDFAPIYDWYQCEKEKKKQMTSQDKVEYLVEEPDDDQLFILSTPPALARPVDLEDLCVRVDILQKQIYALQDELREERQLRIQADDELSKLLHKY